MRQLVLLTLFASLLAHAETVTLEGRLRERGTKKPLPDVNVFILPAKLKTTTDEKGSFKVSVPSESLPDGKFQWVINLTNYKKLELDDSLQERNVRELFLEKNSYLVYETTIFGKGDKRDDSVRTLKAEQFLQMPGSGGDPIKAVQNLAGINRPAPFQAQINIQGSGPQDTRYLINGHEVPLIFHFGGLTSVVTPDAIDQVDLLQAGYGPEYGRATGGLVGVTSRKPKTDRMHGLAFMDIFNSGALLEGPIDKKSGFLISARKSYIGEVLRAVFKKNESFNLTVAPSYWDTTNIYWRELSDKDMFKLTAVGSSDSLGFVLKQPIKQDPAIRGEFSSSTKFFRIIPELTHTHSEDTKSRYSLAYGRDWINFKNSDNYFSLSTHQLTFRSELERKMKPDWTTFLGVDNRYTWATVGASFPTFSNAGGVVNPLSVGVRRTQNVEAKSVVIGGYSRNVVKLAQTRWTLMPNARVDYFKSTKEVLPAPRPAVRYNIDESFFLRAAGGIYYQPPQEQELDEVFGNPDLSAIRAFHYTLGGEKDFRNGSSSGWIASLDGFYKEIDRLVVASTNKVTRSGKLRNENFTNKGTGTVIGAQTQVRLEANPWSLNINYTLSKSTRADPQHPKYPYQYDQTHLIGLIGAFDTGNWRFASRFRYATGNPYTPIIGSAWDADADVYVPKRGPFYSQRLEPFYQLDFRVDKKWIYNTWILTAYLDIQNVTNRANPEQLVYSYDYSKSEKIAGLPILPTIGLKGEF